MGTSQEMFTNESSPSYDSPRRIQQKNAHSFVLDRRESDEK